MAVLIDHGPGLYADSRVFTINCPQNQSKSGAVNSQSLRKSCFANALANGFDFRSPK
jgi:hypothetical protein